MSRRDPIVLVHDMLDYAREAHKMARGRTRADLDSDRMLELSLTRLVEVVGEAASRVPKEFRERHPEVEWALIAGTRNRLVRGYAYVDLDALWQVIEQDLVPLIAGLEKILSASAEAGED